MMMPTSRARLAAVTGLTKATVSSLVDSLVAGGLVAELGPAAAPRVGRPGSQVALSGSGPVGIGLEINVDYLATMTVDLSGTVRQRETITGDLRTSQPGTVLARAAMALRRAVERAQIGGAQVAGVAVAVPGLVETDLDPMDQVVVCRVNGEQRQRGFTKDMVVDPFMLLAYISQVMTLMPGDVVSTGTPEGVGPIRRGDTVEVEISGIGILRNGVF